MMNLRVLLLIHGVLTFGAGMVLMVAPRRSPGAVGVHIDSDAYVLCYLLGAAELAIAFLSFASLTLYDEKALRVIVWTFVVFHICTAVAELYAYIRGLSEA